MACKAEDSDDSRPAPPGRNWHAGSARAPLRKPPAHMLKASKGHNGPGCTRGPMLAAGACHTLASACAIRKLDHDPTCSSLLEAVGWWTKGGLGLVVVAVGRRCSYADPYLGTAPQGQAVSAIVGAHIGRAHGVGGPATARLPQRRDSGGCDLMWWGNGQVLVAG